jgi:putative heme-binding domain-containing protein
VAMRHLSSALASALCVAALLDAGTARAQIGHGFTPQDIESGGLLYQANCTGCHGPDGDGVASVNLGSGRFRRASSDEEVARIIQVGVPGTAMPPSTFSEAQAMFIVAYLRSLADAPGASAVPLGDRARGKAIFEGKGQCLTCHSVAGVGSRVAPVLTEIGSTRRAVELQRSLLEPSAEIRIDNRFGRAVANDGTITTGRLMNHDTFTVQLLDMKERLILLDRASLREFTILKESPMPSYRERLSPAELADLVGYLAGLRIRR